MTDLERFRDHARAMSLAEHKPECESLRKAGWVLPHLGNGDRYWMGLREWIPPKCDGCIPDAERALWTQLADEADAHLGRYREDTLL